MTRPRATSQESGDIRQGMTGLQGGASKIAPARKSRGGLAGLHATVVLGCSDLWIFFMGAGGVGVVVWWRCCVVDWKSHVWFWRQVRGIVVSLGLIA